VPELRKSLKRPETYLACVIVLMALATIDSYRDPSRQWTAHTYVGAVHLYQEHVSPHLSSIVQCRFHPTCSHYSVAVVQRFGIRRGLVLSAERIWRCRGDVPLGTYDPPPTN
jgi:putative membrane protein insertion efficiency factor